jgi:hypothetical protein
MPCPPQRDARAPTVKTESQPAQREPREARAVNAKSESHHVEAMIYRPKRPIVPAVPATEP